ncbi:hypothetical protein Tcan_08827 [Toxocara canis]|uniref:Uncharacterized protein n=1 Tax=Toxocara canis TaxID=6265 RepID=A0A0B2URV0_TOXCA|nr:hypothetical protein Tcan_08827 [Toxocara canis]
MEACNIMVDPRVYRGSVIANRRAQEQRLHKEIHKQEHERRFRADVIRNRLSMGLSRYVRGPTETHATKPSRISRLASLAGYERLPRPKPLPTNGITRVIPSGRIPSRFPKDIPIDQRGIDRGVCAKSRATFKNVRLLPVETPSPIKYATAAVDRLGGIRRSISTPPPTAAGFVGRNDALVQTSDVCFFQCTSSYETNNSSTVVFNHD